MEDLRTSIQARVIEALEVQGQSQNRLASQIGVSAATIINVKRGNWESISDSMVSQFKSYFKIDNWGVRNTPNFSAIIKLCEDARDNKRFLACAGFTGAGKTTALRHFARQNSEAYYVLGTVLHTKRTFLQDIQRAIGISEGSSIHDMMTAIIRKMNASQAAVLIVDDAGKLSHTCLRLLQIIYDQTEFSAGIVIAGTEYLKVEMDRASRRNVMGFQELRRRIAYWQPLRRPTKAIVEKLCEEYHIHDKGAVEYIYANAKDYGTLRNMVLNASALAEKAETIVNREVLVDLHVGDMTYEASQV
jgi:type II secretory pathway predicted ATPase ExeA